jgi:hypothetical protein
MSGLQRQLPRYQCHKKVWALKIAAINGTTITPADDGYASFEAPPEYIVKHEPKAGGYYVVYEDGYKSFSPAEAFESGYTRIETGDPHPSPR